MFNTVFAGDARLRLDAALDDLSADDYLRVRLDLTEASDLEALPWEYLFYPERHTFLALSPDTTFVRYVQTPEPIQRMRVEPPLRILAMACSPKDLPRLELALERRRLERSLSQLVKTGLVEIDWAENNSLTAINHALTDKTYHIFHFMGHGDYVEDENGTNGVLYFEDADGYPAPVTGELLGWTFRRRIKLAVLNACEGARGEADDLSSGVASSLLLQGIPAVVAMQFEITDVVAVHFAHDFYSAIATGLPVDAAATQARRNVMTSFTTSAEWATPVLFMRSPDGQIFDIDLKKHAHEVKVVQESAWNVGEIVTTSRDAFGKLKRWASDSLSSSPTSEPEPMDDLYEQAVAHMSAERWSEASRLFEKINKQRPGYRGIAARWLESERQAGLAKMYGRMVSRYAQRKWSQVLSECENILRIDPNFKDAPRIYAEAQTNLNRLKPIISPAPRPPGLPGGSRQEQRPTSLPNEHRRPKPDRPPELPG